MVPRAGDGRIADPGLVDAALAQLGLELSPGSTRKSLSQQLSDAELRDTASRYEELELAPRDEAREPAPLGASWVEPCCDGESVAVEVRAPGGPRPEDRARPRPSLGGLLDERLKEALPPVRGKNARGTGTLESARGPNKPKLV